MAGMELTPSLAFAERLARLRNPVWVRFVLVPGLTGDPAGAHRVLSSVFGETGYYLRHAEQD